ncbi:MAG: hypothetical protein ACLR1T_10560 [Evtepia gabavorous]
MTVSVTSFGFKYGIPIDADLVFDVRFLPNPYYIAELKECTGLEEAVRAFLFGYRQTTEFMRHLEELFAFLLPQYVGRGSPPWSSPWAAPGTPPLGGRCPRLDGVHPAEGISGGGNPPGHQPIGPFGSVCAPLWGVCLGGGRLCLCGR